MPSGGQNRGNGDHLNWLRANVGHVGDDCLIWPFYRNHQGYGLLGYYGKVRKAHRIMCILASGDPPSPKHHAAHSCGKGSSGCVHPGHLSWKTPRENRLDANAHGTGSSNKGKKRMDPATVLMIRKSPKSYLVLAKELGVYWGTVGKIKRGELYPNLKEEASAEG